MLLVTKEKSVAKSPSSGRDKTIAKPRVSGGGGVGVTAESRERQDSILVTKVRYSTHTWQ